MKILVDMNLSPDWVAAFSKYRIDAVHWSTVGDPRAEDIAIMNWARENDHIVFTHDLDFGTLLALNRMEIPSVIQVRAQDVTPAALEHAVVDILEKNESTLQNGALIVLDEVRARIRILPIR